MEQIIVSFTSYPKRINTIGKVLDTIIRQTVLPDKIILYLSSSEFKDFGELPDFTRYEKYGFEIHWNEENLKSHKKWFYAFQEYQDDVVITIDDDVLYPDTMLETLLRYHKMFPNCVVARNAHLITCQEDGTISPYNDWIGSFLYVGVPRMDLEAVGNAGILYPAHFLEDREAFNKEVFMSICQYADDLWLKVMEIYAGIPVVLAQKSWDDQVLKEQQEGCLSRDYNNNGGNDRQFKALLERYPYTYTKEILVDRIFRDGCILYKDARRVVDRENERILNELAEQLGNYGEILVYGAGDVGSRIYWLLKNFNKEVIKAFVVENTEDNVDTIGDVPVKNYRDFIDSNEKILIALLDGEGAAKVRSALMEKGVNTNRIIMMNNAQKTALMEKVFGLQLKGGFCHE